MNGGDAGGGGSPGGLLPLETKNGKLLPLQCSPFPGAGQTGGTEGRGERQVVPPEGTTSYVLAEYGGWGKEK